MLNKDLRKRIIEKGTEIGCTHFPSAFSCVDFVKYLYDNILEENKDLFIMSKGHGEMALFSVLESKGKKPTWTIHLNYNESEGIYSTSGSLGHGLPIGVGRAFGKKLKNEEGNVYVLLGDGEMEEGSNWEALTLAKKLNVDNLSLFIDWNKYQATGAVKDVGGIDSDSLLDKLRSFGCNVSILNGHDYTSLSKLNYLSKGLNAVILNTIKGKGLEYFEKNHFHGFDFRKYPEEYKKALEELK